MIEVRNLVKSYGNHRAVSDLSFQVEAGKVVGFLGPNGAGKSTTMNMLTGYIAQTAGTILIDGIDMAQEPEKAKKHIGYLPEMPPLYMDLRVREYLAFVSDLKRVNKKERDTMVLGVMEKTKISDMSERLIRHLSKGYKQRVGLAAALIGNPDILILDEPTVGLDPGQIIEIRDLIRELGGKHTVLLSSHIMQEISAVCDEIIIINNGKMIACDTPENLIRQMARRNGIALTVRGEKEEVLPWVREMPQVAEVREEESQENEVSFTVYSDGEADIREDIFYAMAQKGCPILEMRHLNTTLEDAFLALTEGGDMDGNGDEMPEEDGNIQERVDRESDTHGMSMEGDGIQGETDKRSDMQGGEMHRQRARERSFIRSISTRRVHK